MTETLTPVEEEVKPVDDLQDQLEAIEPNVESKDWTLREYDDDRKVVAEAVYTQKTLSYFAKLELIAKFGQVLDMAMSGPDGLTLDSLLSGASPLTGRATSPESLLDADSFVHMIARLSAYAPDLMLDLYCIFLSVPMGERPWAKQQMMLTEEDGGFSDDDGFEILSLFLDQNGEVLRDFFTKRIKPLTEKARKTLGSGDKESQSQQSKSTRPATRRRSKKS